jgi:hypothetical protein
MYFLLYLYFAKISIAGLLHATLSIDRRTCKFQTPEFLSGTLIRMTYLHSGESFAEDLKWAKIDKSLI